MGSVSPVSCVVSWLGVVVLVVRFGEASSMAVRGSPISPSSFVLCFMFVGIRKMDVVLSPCRGEEGGVGCVDLIWLVVRLPRRCVAGEGALDGARLVALLFVFDLLLRLAVECGLPRLGMFLPEWSSHSGVGEVLWSLSSCRETLCMSKSAKSCPGSVGTFVLWELFVSCVLSIVMKTVCISPSSSR